MNPINRIGQKVVCIKRDHLWPLISCPSFKHYPKYGKVYTVTAFATYGMPCIHLRENPDLSCACANMDGIGWPIIAFRPLDERKTDISVFRELLNPTPTKVREDA